ncbi:MAG: redoxin domain-containing protein [Nocardioides sp.]|nr:redoxin domain-containing protein [Nocardioides sp.]
MTAPLAVGTQAPSFGLRDQHGADVARDAGEGRATLLVFFPFAFSGVCTKELRGLQEVAGELGELGVRVVGVSCDPVFALRSFADADGITFPLLSDFWPHGEVAQAYGVLDEARGCPRRSSFLLDDQGVLRWSLHHRIGDPRPVSAHLDAARGLSG